MPVIETSIDKAWGFSTCFFHTLIKQRQKIKHMDGQKYVGRIQELGQYERRHSSFYIGLYGQNWVMFLENP